MINKVLWRVTMSPDGFIASPRDAMNWMTRFFGSAGAAPLDMDTIAVSQAGQVVNLRFRVLKSASQR